MAVAAQTRPRTGSGRLFIIVGAALAALAFVLVFVIGTVTGTGHGAGGATVKVVVAARDIPLRAPLGKDDLTLADMAQSDVPPHAYTKVDDVVRGNLIAELNVSKGQPLTENMLARTGDVVAGAQPAYLPIPQGFVAITIPTGEQQGVAGYIQAGDYINIISTVSTTLFQQGSSNGAPPKNVSVTVFNNLHVLRLGASTGSVQPASGGNAQQATATGVPSSVTVVTTQCDAQYLNWILTYTSVKYTLGSYKDYQPQDTKVDASCPNSASAKPMSSQQVDQRYGFTRT